MTEKKSVEEILSAVEQEFQLFKDSMCILSGEQIFSNAWRINVFTELYDYFVNSGNEFEEDELNALFIKTRGQILDRLVTRYVHSEGYEISSQDDIRMMIGDYLEED